MKGNGNEELSSLRLTAVRVHWLEGSTELNLRKNQLVWLPTEDLHRRQRMQSTVSMRHTILGARAGASHSTRCLLQKKHHPWEVSGTGRFLPGPSGRDGRGTGDTAAPSQAQKQVPFRASGTTVGFSRRGALTSPRSLAGWQCCRSAQGSPRRWPTPPQRRPQRCRCRSCCRCSPG